MTTIFQGAEQAASITDYDDLYVVFTSKAYPIA